VRASLLAARFLDLFRSGPQSATLQVAGYAIPEGTAMVKCGLCKAAIPRDDFQGHANYHSAVQHTDIETIRKLAQV
jgi:flavoprotein